MSEMPKEIWVSYAEDANYYSASAAITKTHDDMARYLRADLLQNEAKALADELDAWLAWHVSKDVDQSVAEKALAFLHRLAGSQ